MRYCIHSKQIILTISVDITVGRSAGYSFTFAYVVTNTTDEHMGADSLDSLLGTRLACADPYGCQRRPASTHYCIRTCSWALGEPTAHRRYRQPVQVGSVRTHLVGMAGVAKENRKGRSSGSQRSASGTRFSVHRMMSFVDSCLCGQTCFLLVVVSGMRPKDPSRPSEIYLRIFSTARRTALPWKAHVLDSQSTTTVLDTSQQPVVQGESQSMSPMRSKPARLLLPRLAMLLQNQERVKCISEHPRV